MQGAKHCATDMAVKDRLEEVAIDGRETAPVHCEIQLLTYFLRPNAPKCVDYFGCSKKSCWLCWHMMVQNFQFSMKDTHRKIYPRWALPSEFTLSHTQAAEGLKIAYNEMLSLLQHKVIKGISLKSPGSLIQSSARVTPWSGLGEFSGDRIEAFEWGLLPLARIPALYIPEDGYPRPVAVAVYESSRLFDGCIMKIGDYGGRDVILAFQMKMERRLRTKIMKAETDENIPLELDEFQSTQWLFDLIFGAETEEGLYEYYAIYYRGTEASLGPNRSLLETWKDVHGGIYGECPWQGDVFAFSFLSPTLFELDLKEVTSTVDSSAFFEGLARHWRVLGPEYANKRREIDRAIATGAPTTGMMKLSLNQLG
ncbi:hypothetical protein GGR55DRAFT_593372 [Xylaria sp. FL0064]|nr:hypothetical protein GGR55DRAFT_593372 [Xylaria sp. FL0064]